jgi:Zn-dependent protease
VSVLTTLLLFVSVLLHELGHAAVALQYQVPVRGISLFIFGGVAQIEEEPSSPLAEFWIAIAGPLVSFVLAMIFGLLQVVLAGPPVLLALVKYLTYANGTLAVFNLIPGFPLDGGRVIRAMIWAVTGNFRRAALVAAHLGRAVSFLFVIVGIWQIVVGNVGTGLWLAFIGWFLETAARAAIRRQRIKDLLAGHYVSEAMDPQHTAIPASTTLQKLEERHNLATGQGDFMIEVDDHTKGLLTSHQIQKVPRSEWPTTSAGRIMLPVTQVKSVEPDGELWTVLQQMERDGVSRLPVITNGQVQGTLSRERIMRFLRMMREHAA